MLTLNKLWTTLIVLLLVGSLFAPIGAATAASSSASTGPPSGMVGVPESNVGAPDHANGGGNAGGGPPAGAGPPMHALDNIPTHASAWDVHADKHAGDLEVEVGATPDDELALRLTDDVNHDGREVALERQTLVDAIGHAPQAAHGIHESGEEWSAPIRYEGSHAVFKVPKFSTNTVTFDGEAVLTGDPASNGASYQYNLSDASSADNFTVDLTGVSRTSGTNTTKTGSVSAGSSSTTSVSVDGNREPVGPTGSGEPTIETTYTGSNTLHSDTNTHTAGDSDGDTTTWYIGDTGHIDQVGVNMRNCLDDGDVQGKLHVAEGNVGSDVFSDPDGTNSYYTSTLEGGCFDIWKSVSTDFDNDTGVTIGLEVSMAGSDPVNSVSVTETDVTGTPPFTVDATSSTDSVSFDGRYDSNRVLDLPAGTQDVTVNSTESIDWALKYRERAVTEDVGLTINNQTVSYSGELAEGETATLSPSTDLLVDGTNVVEIGTATEYGFAPDVGLRYSHSAAVDQTVDYVSETWSERYNVTRTYDSASSNATVTIPFESSRVIAVRDVQKRVDGGSWSSLSESEITLDGTTLEANLGDISSGSTVDVRATGSKVRAQNGEIDVLEPTAPGSDLETEFEVTDYSEGMHLEVGETNQGDRIHELINRSWSDGAPYTRFHADGSTELYLDGAGVGAMAIAQTRPVAVSPSAGDVDVSWHPDGSNSEPMFRVEPGSQQNGDVEYTYLGANDGEEYDLYSRSSEVVRDSATANSPVTLVDDDSEETLVILNAESSSVPEDGSGGGGFYSDPRGTASAAASTAVSTVAPLIPPEAIALLVLVVIGGAIAYTERAGDRAPLYRREEVGVAAAFAVGLAIFLVSPASITGPIQTALSAALPLASIFGVLGGAYLLYSWRQERISEASTPDQVFRVGAEEEETQTSDGSDSNRWF